MNKLIIILVAIIASWGCSKDNTQPNVNTEMKIASIKFESSSLQLVKGESSKLILLHTPIDLKAPEYILTNSNPDVVQVDGFSVIGLKVGESTILATVKGTDLKAELKVIVSQITAEKLILTAEREDINIGESISIKYSIEPVNTTDINDKVVEWITSNKEIATVDDSGKVSGLTEGQVEITGLIRGTGVVGKITIKVLPIPVTSIVFKEKQINILEGAFSSLSYSILPENASNKNLKWESLDVNVATVKDGTVTGVSVGTTKIKVTTIDGAKEDFINVTVTPVMVNQLFLNKMVLKLQTGNKETLVASLLPINAKDKTITWVSSNNAVATVDNNGTITAIAKGLAVITANSNSNKQVTAKCQLEVVEPADLVQTYFSSSSTVNINGVITGNITAVIGNFSTNSVRYISFEIRNYNNVVISRNTEAQNISAGKQLSFSTRLTNVDSPKMYFVFELDGVRYNRVLNFN